MQRRQVLFWSTSINPRHQRARKRLVAPHLGIPCFLLIATVLRRALRIAAQALHHRLRLRRCAAIGPNPPCHLFPGFVVQVVPSVRRSCAAIVLARAPARWPGRADPLRRGLGSVVRIGAGGADIAVVVELRGVVVETSRAHARPTLGTALGALITHRTVGQHILYQVRRRPLRVPFRHVRLLRRLPAARPHVLRHKWQIGAPAAEARGLCHEVHSCPFGKRGWADILDREPKSGGRGQPGARGGKGRWVGIQAAGLCAADGLLGAQADEGADGGVTQARVPADYRAKESLEARPPRVVRELKHGKAPPTRQLR
mmetsp:Transcript_47680/g.126042  ORF Transcript_47680/g.126042 Transcript_47680/m.126042 type:complete len:314 (+) Transcript_47680:2103-3044(+)